MTFNMYTVTVDPEASPIISIEFVIVIKMKEITPH